MDKKIIGGAIVVVLLAAGIGIGVSKHNQSVAAAAHAKVVKIEKSNLLKAKDAVKLAYKSRKTEDISAANKAIEKLDTNQKKDKSSLQKKMSELKSFLVQISDVNNALAKATKSKDIKDITSTQNLIDKETDKYLANDKKIAQAKLNTLKKQIADAAAKAEAVAKAKAAQAAAQQTATNQASQQTQQTPATAASSVSSGYSGGQAATDQAPASQVPAQSAPATQAPSSGSSSSSQSDSNTMYATDVNGNHLWSATPSGDGSHYNIKGPNGEDMGQFGN